MDAKCIDNATASDSTMESMGGHGQAEATV